MSSFSDSVFQPLTVVVADSNQLQAQLLTGALRRRPDFKVTACESQAVSVLETLQQAPADVLLLNRSTPGDDCFTLVRHIHVAHPVLPIVLLLEGYDRDTVVNAFRSGARGIFSFSESSFRSLCKCIHVMRDGQVWISQHQQRILLDLVCQVPSLRVVNQRGRSLLTPREEQVVALVAEGLSNRDVSRELCLSEHTIKKYLFRIFDKLGVSNRVELVLYAVNHSDSRPVEWMAGLPAWVNEGRGRKPVQPVLPAVSLARGTIDPAGSVPQQQRRVGWIDAGRLSVRA